MKKVILQLDYYLGGQFAGLATGLARGLFASRGLDVSLVAPCTPGNEGTAVVAHQRQVAKLRSSSSPSPGSATRSTTILR